MIQLLKHVSYLCRLLIMQHRNKLAYDTIYTLVTPVCCQSQLLEGVEGDKWSPWLHPHLSTHWLAIQRKTHFFHKKWIRRGFHCQAAVCKWKLLSMTTDPMQNLMWAVLKGFRFFAVANRKINGGLSPFSEQPDDSYWTDSTPPCLDTIRHQCGWTCTF